ncbi:PorV/PorQ family protein [Candidatus Neomarinimicrobiota bacterium]
MRSGHLIISIVASLILSKPLLLHCQESEDPGFLSVGGFEKVAQTGYQFLKIGIGTRAPGMGEAATTMQGGADNTFWNPAGIAHIDKRAIHLGYIIWFADISHLSFAAAWNLGKYGSVGLSLLSMDYGTIEGTAINGLNNIGYDDTGNLDPQEYAIGITYARRFTDRFSMGGTAKLCSQDLVAKSSQALALDFGTLYNIGWNDFTLGMTIQHFSREIRYIEEYFELPLIFRIGFSVDFISLFGMESSTHQATFAFEGANPRDYSERIHAGVEYWYQDLIALRAGYKFNYDNEDLSYGAAIKLAGISLGYAHSAFGSILGVVDRFSIHYEF